MKTVFINCSPKKKFTASSYFIFLSKLFIKDKKVKETLRTPADHDRILEQIRDADNVVFAVPLYVDGIPSHVLGFLEKAESFCRENSISFNVYVVANNGFIEGKQNEPLMRHFSNFCSRAGLDFMGGVGIGGGVMLNVTRILFFVDIALIVLNTILSVIHTGNFFPKDPWISFLENAAILLFLNFGVLFYLIRMGINLNRGRDNGKKYTRIMIPSFIFIIFADIFFIIISIFEGGIFRGWFARKKYEG
jgi:hypothetical protein